MSLELNQVTQQIDDMGRLLADRLSRQQQALPAARALLRQFAHAQEALGRIAQSDPGQHLRCAYPGDEPLDASLPLPGLPPCVTIVAADGSQIYPDRHGLAFYYLINVGSIVFRQGSGQAPDVAAEPRLYYADDQVFPEGNPVTSDLVSAQRDLAELRTLAALGLAEPAQDPPRLALADGSLLPWLQRAALSEGQRQQLLDDYLEALDRCRAGDLALAGFVSRPHSAEVVALLYLAQLPEEERPGIKSLSDTPYRGLTDRALFGFLRTGERSALFSRGTAMNRDFRARGHTVLFFYMNTGADLARVEVPEWVARSPERLALVQAAVSDQCRFNNGYPYVLTRADEQAVIMADERQILEDMIARALARHGLPLPELSRKAQQKRVARRRGRR
jgi:hypothetical protein